MKNHALFSLKDKSEKIKCCLLQVLFGTLRVKGTYYHSVSGEIKQGNFEAFHKIYEFNKMI